MINDILNSNLSDSVKVELIKILQKGGNVQPKLLTDEKGNSVPAPDPNKLSPAQKLGAAPVTIKGKEYYLTGDKMGVLNKEYADKKNSINGGKRKPLKPTDTITIGDKEFDVEVVDTPEAMRIGLSDRKKLEFGTGMIFVYEHPTSGYFTMYKTDQDLDIIFIDEDNEVISVQRGKAFSNKKYQCDGFKYVLETTPKSGVQPGDEMDEDDAEQDYGLVSPKMFVLNSNGDVQMTLSGGERIFSRIFSRKLVKAALQAYREETDASYQKVAKMVFKEIKAQDEREPEYVDTPE